ncbi:hypothetical protein [Paenibacillus sp. 1P03SA]|uniref:hypothetical protein n=1 Tax=Paenibacillus sp. 1P03SA TaxID=3132294 RepID=UPI0039A26EAC
MKDFTILLALVWLLNEEFDADISEDSEALKAMEDLAEKLCDVEFPSDDDIAAFRELTKTTAEALLAEYTAKVREAAACTE